MNDGLKSKQNIWLALLLVVLASNYTLYNTGFGTSFYLSKQMVLSWAH